MSLYEIAKDFEAVLNGAMVIDEETGELLFDASDLDALEMAFNDKLENCGLYIKNLEAECDAIKTEINALRGRMTAKEGKVLRLRQYVLDCMDIAGQNRLETARVALSQRKSSYVEIIDESMVPEDYKEYVETVKVSKSDISKAMKAGKEIAGAELKERINLQVK